MGGGIANFGTLVLTRVTFRGNPARFGRDLFNGRTATLTRRCGRPEHGGDTISNGDTGSRHTSLGSLSTKSRLGRPWRQKALIQGADLL